MKLRYLVVGTGRSGTVFMARLLTSVGVPCGHEMIFDHQGLNAAEQRLHGSLYKQTSYASRNKNVNGQWLPLDDWLNTLEVEADSSYMAVPFLQHDILVGTKIIHVVRNPVKVINSFCNYIDYFKSSEPCNPYEEFMYKYIPDLHKDMCQYDRAALFWVKWNELIERRQPDLFHRIEDSSENVLSFLGKAGPCFSDPTINTFRKSAPDRFFPDKIKSKDIYQIFIEMGKKYGYSMDSEYLLL